MKFDKDYFDNPTVPDFVLCKGNKERIGILKCSTKTLDVKYNAPNEISFTVYMNIDDKKNPYYDAIDIMKYILLPDYGFFSISECKIRSEGTTFEYKEVVAKSFEVLLGQKYINTFSIDIGTVESIDGVSFYNIADPSKSLLNLILDETASEWKIGHCDVALMSMQRSFQIDRQDIYSFLMNDVAKAFECVFLFDTLTCTINIYKEENFGKDTNIHVSYNNLLKNTDISCSIDDIKTCITPTGSDDLTIREVNMGSDRIINLDYFHTTEYMSQELYDAFGKWKLLREGYVSEYNTLLSKYQDSYSRINYLTNKKMPTNPESTNWSEYGLVPLKEQLSSYEQRQSVMMKSGWGNSESPYYETAYLPVYNTIQAINAQIIVVENELSTLKTEQDVYYNQMFNIINVVAMENNFTENELRELNSFIREDEISTDNYIVTDIMTDEERFAMLDEFLEYSETELAKVATPQLSFTADMANIFTIDEFSSLFDNFDIGNYIWVTLRDDYHIKARLLEIHINFYEFNDFTVKFGNILKKSKNRYSDVSKTLKDVQSVATSVSFNQSYWNESAKNTDKIGQMIEDGLLGAGAFLTSGVDSEMVIDNRGIFVNTTTGDYAGLDSIFLGGGRILFTDDNWKTVAMAVGRAEVNGQSRFGVFADFLIAGYVSGSTIEGGTITGTRINNGNGTFSVDENGNMIANSGQFKGKISASEITGSSFNNGNGTFSVDTNGKLTASDAHITKGTIGGAKIENSSIHATNNNWSINSDGTTSFKNVFVSGVQNGSAFGGVNVGANGSTSGNFSNGFSADTSFGVTGGALQNFQDLVANKVTAAYIDATVQLSANYATITSLDAVNARVGTIEANYATVGDLNITKSLVVGVDDRVTVIENDYIKTAQLNAVKASVNTLTTNVAHIEDVLTINGNEASWIHVSLSDGRSFWALGKWDYADASITDTNETIV